MSPRFARGLLFIFFVLFVTACSRRERPAVERLAILPFSVLSDEGESDHAGPALLTSALASLHDLDPVLVDSIPQAYARHANRFLFAYVVSRSGKLQLQADVEDATSHKMLRSLHVEGEASAGMGPLAAKLAQELDAAAKPVDSPSSQAYRELNRALDETAPEKQDQAFQAAIQADPHFGAAYVGWVRVLLQRGNNDRSADVASQGESAGIDDFSKANLAYLKARAKQDIEGQISALKQLTTLAPASSEDCEHLAEMEFTRRQFAESAAHYREALRLDPANGVIGNMRGYAEAFAGNLEQARQSLKTYAETPGQQGNALDSLGEVDFFSGDFAGAETAFLAAQTKNPAGGEWLKAAQARLMTGDLAGADQIFSRFSKGLGVYQRARWDFLTGRRKSALDKVQQEAAATHGDAAALLWAQAAIWQLQLGDQPGARGSARNILLQPASPTRNSMAGLTQFLLSGGPHHSGSPLIDALAAIFQKDFSTALPLLEKAYQATGPTTDGQVRVLLAWANLESGHVDRAAQLLRVVPIPMESGDPIFTSLIFPRFFALRAAVLNAQGKPAEAQHDQKLYAQYSGG